MIFKQLVKVLDDFLFNESTAPTTVGYQQLKEILIDMDGTKNPFSSYNVNFKGFDFEQAELKGVRIPSGFDFSNISLENAVFDMWSCTGDTLPLRYCTFHNSNLKGIVLRAVQFLNCTFKNISFSKTDFLSKNLFVDCLFEDSTFTHCKIPYGFTNCTFKNVHFLHKSVLKGSGFTKCHFIDCTFDCEIENIEDTLGSSAGETLFQKRAYEENYFTRCTLPKNIPFLLNLEEVLTDNYEKYKSTNDAFIFRKVFGKTYLDLLNSFEEPHEEITQGLIRIKSEQEKQKYLKEVYERQSK